MEEAESLSFWQSNKSCFLSVVQQLENTGYGQGKLPPISGGIGTS